MVERDLGPAPAGAEELQNLVARTHAAEGVSGPDLKERGEERDLGRIGYLQQETTADHLVYAQLCRAANGVVEPALVRPTGRVASLPHWTVGTSTSRNPRSHTIAEINTAAATTSTHTRIFFGRLSAS